MHCTGCLNGLLDARDQNTGLDALPCCIIQNLPALSAINQRGGEPKDLIFSDPIINGGNQFCQPFRHKISGAVRRAVDLTGLAKSSQRADQMASVIFALPGVLDDSAIGMILAREGNTISAGKRFGISHGSLLFGWLGKVAGGSKGRVRAAHRHSERLGPEGKKGVQRAWDCRDDRAEGKGGRIGKRPEPCFAAHCGPQQNWAQIAVLVQAIAKARTNQCRAVSTREDGAGIRRLP